MSPEQEHKALIRMLAQQARAISARAVVRIATMRAKAGQEKAPSGGGRKG